MNNFSKIVWITAMLIICGIGIFAGNRRNLMVESKRASLTEVRFSVREIEAELRATYPEFSGAQNVEIGLARTMSSTSTLELTVTDRSGNRYVCLIGRTTSGWRIERVKRLKIATMGLTT